MGVEGKGATTRQRPTSNAGGAQSLLTVIAGGLGMACYSCRLTHSSPPRPQSGLEIAESLKQGVAQLYTGLPSNASRSTREQSVD